MSVHGSVLSTWLIWIKPRPFPLPLSLLSSCSLLSCVFPLLMSADNTLSRWQNCNSMGFQRDGFRSSPSISTTRSPSWNISFSFVVHGKNKAVEGDVSIPEFTSLAAQLTNIDLWPLLWLLHNTLNGVFLLFCLQPKNLFFNKKTQKCLWRIRTHKRHYSITDVQVCTYSCGPHGLQLLRLMRVQRSPCLVLLQMHEIEPQNCLCLFRHLLHAITCARLLLGEPRRKGRKALNVLSKHLVSFPFCPSLAGGAAHFLCNLPCLKSPENQLLNSSYLFFESQPYIATCLSQTHILVVFQELVHPKQQRPASPPILGLGFECDGCCGQSCANLTFVAV